MVAPENLAGEVAEVGSAATGALVLLDGLEGTSARLVNSPPANVLNFTHIYILLLLLTF